MQLKNAEPSKNRPVPMDNLTDMQSVDGKDIGCYLFGESGLQLGRQQWREYKEQVNIIQLARTPSSEYIPS